MKCPARFAVQRYDVYHNKGTCALPLLSCAALGFYHLLATSMFVDLPRHAGNGQGET